MDSPPKRMTRARAAAKATEPTVKTTKIVTAAAKAKSSTATAGTKSTAAKRKTRADESDEQQQQEVEPPKKAPRGRPKKAEPVEPAPAITAPKATRGRPPKKPTTETSKPDAAPPVKATRGRPKKVVEPEPEVPTTKASRARAATISKAAATAATRKPSVKKTVKFQEPDKENFEPVIKKEPVTAGLRGRPARRGATATTKTATRKSEPGEKKPLSPKKVTQMPVSRDEESEDELAGDDHVPIKPMQKSPVKPSSSMKRPERIIDEQDSDNTLQVSNAILNPPEKSSVMASPARRIPSLALKDTMKSPARKIGAVPFPDSAFKTANQLSDYRPTSPSKNNLLQSPAKRPASPIKGLQLGSIQKEQSSPAMKPSLFSSPAKRAMPGLKPLIELSQIEALSDSPAMRPLVMSTSTPASARLPSEKALLDEEPSDDTDEDDDEGPFNKPITNIQFPGRLSAILSRDADPDDDMVFSEEEQEHVEFSEEEKESDKIATEAEGTQVKTPVSRTGSEEVEEQSTIEPAEPLEEIEDPLIDEEMLVEMEDFVEEAEASIARSPAPSPPQPANDMYRLRQKDLDPCQDSDDEDDMTFHVQATPTTSSFTMKKHSRRSTLGLNSLAEQFDSWSAASPVKAATPAAKNPASDTVLPVEKSPREDAFFEEAVFLRPDAMQQDTSAVSEQLAAEVENAVFDDVMLVDEDFDLAQEADEMSLKESEQHNTHDDTLSDASQEYGDENDVPIDPAIMAPAPAPFTPVRPVKKVFFHTTTKVPLKPADDSTPSPIKNRSFSASRVAPKRPSGLRSASVISYSPEKESRHESFADSAPSKPTPTTPTTKNDMWAAMGTPARTPHKYLDSALLRGAVVFVDVYTSEGADASGIFVELLNQMGARCIKRWDYNPNGLSNEELYANKIGITHVIFKDGSKRTLEKVRMANGVVQCVGVSWVLDCERENEWLDEAPYSINTSNVPRGGARRRKSMEPKALANMNGTLVNSPTKGSSSRDSQAAPGTPNNRRQSAVWMHTPSDLGVEEEDDDVEWSKFILTPVPKTPAPEAVARYAAEIPETPCSSNDSSMMDDSPTPPLGTRTCPPKAHTYRDLGFSCPPKPNLFVDLGAGILSKDKDERVLMRLMAARRKSLQFAPKIGSPLSKTWK